MKPTLTVQSIHTEGTKKKQTQNEIENKIRNKDKKKLKS